MTLGEAQELVRLAEESWDKVKVQITEKTDEITNALNQAAEWQRQVAANATAGNQAGMVANGANYTATMQTVKNLQAQKASLQAQEKTLNTEVVRTRAIRDGIQKMEFEADLAKNNPAAYTAYKLANGQKSTKYLIWGAVALTVLVIGIAVLRKSFQ